MKRLKNRRALQGILLLWTISMIGCTQTGTTVKNMDEQTKTVVFVCEHGSAKSTVAAAHFNKLASERGLSVRAISRGTNPDETFPEKVTAGLKSEGLAAGEPAPKKLTTEDMASAARVVRFCPLPDEYRSASAPEDWSDVPPISEDYAKSRDEMVSRIERLIYDLNRTN